MLGSHSPYNWKSLSLIHIPFPSYQQEAKTLLQLADSLFDGPDKRSVRDKFRGQLLILIEDPVLLHKLNGAAYHIICGRSPRAKLPLLLKVKRL